MKSIDLKNVADAIVRQAEKQGFVLPREVREHLAAAGLSGTLWKEVVKVARPALRYRGGRYYHAASLSERVLRDQDQQQAVQRAVRQILRAKIDDGLPQIAKAVRPPTSRFRGHSCCRPQNCRALVREYDHGAASSGRFVEA